LYYVTKTLKKTHGRGHLGNIGGHQMQGQYQGTLKNVMWTRLK